MICKTMDIKRLKSNDNIRKSKQESKRLLNRFV